MRLLAIGDIHGCHDPLDELLNWVQPTPEDTLVMLGDYVNRGPNTRGVLERLIALQQQTNLICLRGNHEQLMVAAYRGDRGCKQMWLGVGGVETLASYGVTTSTPGTLDDIPAAHWDFLENRLADYHETAHFIFVHAGVLTDMPLEEQPDYALRWDFLPEAMRHHSGKTVICGHSSQRSGMPKIIPGAACIDTRAHGGGWLTCLDVINGRYWQTNLLRRHREGRIDYE